MQAIISIRVYEAADWDAVWRLIQPVFSAGTTYAYSPDISEAEARQVWTEIPLATYVAEEAGEILGTYFLKPNQPGLGGHVCNTGYIVSAAARGRGIASLMCEHSQMEALVRGFRGMQFNLVVATNETAVRLWQKHGFGIIGTLPRAYRHAEHGYVDAHVMYKALQDPVAG